MNKRTSKAGKNGSKNAPSMVNSKDPKRRGSDSGNQPERLKRHRVVSRSPHTDSDSNSEGEEENEDAPGESPEQSGGVEEDHDVEVHRTEGGQAADQTNNAHETFVHRKARQKGKCGELKRPDRGMVR